MIDWRQWHNEPALVEALILAAWLYAMATGPLRARLAPAEPYSRRSALRFYTGLALFYLVVGTPAESVGRFYLFSANMLVQMAILYPVAWLLLTGIPRWLIDAVLGSARITELAGRVLFHPLVCGAFFVLSVSVWYVPRIYEWGLQRPWHFGAEHLLFAAAGAMFWWPLSSRSEIFPPLRFGARMIYLFATQVAMTAVFSYLLMAEHPLYPTYELAPRLLPALDPINDQTFAGILLSAMSSLVMVSALGVSFFRWSKTSEPSGHRAP
jgi:putative membrane protein